MHSTANVVSVINKKGLQWLGLIVHVDDMNSVYKILLINQKVRDAWEN